MTIPRAETGGKNMLQENVLLVGGTEKSRALLQALIPPG